MELALHQILWAGALRIWPCGSAPLATNDTFQSHLAHQPPYRAAGDIDAFASELVPDLTHSINTKIIVPYPTDLIAEPSVFCAPCRGMFLSGLMSVIDRWRNRQNPAD